MVWRHHIRHLQRWPHLVGGDAHSARSDWRGGSLHPRPGRWQVHLWRQRTPDVTFYFFPNANCTTSTCQLDVGDATSADSRATWTYNTQIAGPMSLTWLANNNQGSWSAITSPPPLEWIHSLLEPESAFFFQTSSPVLCVGLIFLLFSSMHVSCTERCYS